MVEDFTLCFTASYVDPLIDRFIKWNNNNYRCIILNVDGSCIGSPIRAGFRGLTRNNSGYYLSGYYGIIHGSSDIKLAELYAIYQGLILAKDMTIGELVCYSDSLHCINLIK
ncbi:S-like ribonuclease, partial [Trifolium medium]|nr:S-like ribonuclease [Trifolium medium]